MIFQYQEQFEMNKGFCIVLKNYFSVQLHENEMVDPALGEK